MSHRGLIPAKLARNFFSCTKARYAPLCGVSPSIPVRVPPPHIGISTAQMRAASGLRPRRSNRDTRREDPLSGYTVGLSKDTLKSLKEIGFDETEAYALLSIVHMRCTNFRDARYVHECLRNRVTWSQNESTIPPAYLRLWLNDKLLDFHEGTDIAQISPSFSEEAIGKACGFIGLNHFSRAQGRNSAEHVAEGCFFLEIAVLFGNQLAATHLINILNDPLNVEMLESCDVQTDKRDAVAFIKDLALKNPTTAHPYVLLTYLSDEYGPRKIGGQTPKQLALGLAMLDGIPKPTNVAILNMVEVYDQYQNPAQIKLQIVEHCLKQGIALQYLSLDELKIARAVLLRKLAAYNDPVASMILVAQPNGPPAWSEEWERLLRAAAAGGNGHAIWLLGVHYMRNEGVFPLTPDTKAKLDTSLGFEYARLSIMALYDSPQSLIAYTLGLAALCRAAGHLSQGFIILADSLNEVIERTDFPRSRYRELDAHCTDWDIENPNHKAYWGEQKCKRLLDEYFDPRSRHFQEVWKIYR